MPAGICGCCKRPMPEPDRTGLTGPALVASFLCSSCLPGIRERALKLLRGKPGTTPEMLAKLGEPIH